MRCFQVAAKPRCQAGQFSEMGPEPARGEEAETRRARREFAAQLPQGAAISSVAVVRGAEAEEKLQLDPNRRVSVGRLCIRCTYSLFAGIRTVVSGRVRNSGRRTAELWCERIPVSLRTQFSSCVPDARLLPA